MSVKLTTQQRRTLRRLAKAHGVTMTDIITKGIEYVDQAFQLAQIGASGGGDVPAPAAVDLIPLKRGS